MVTTFYTLVRILSILFFKCCTYYYNLPRWHFRKKMTEGLVVRKAEQRTTLNTSRQPLSRSAPAPLTQGSLWLSANIGWSRKIMRTMLRAIQYFASLHGTLASQVCDRPYRLYSVPHRRGDSRIARMKQTVRTKHNGGAPNFPPFIVGGDVLDAP